MLKLRNPGWPPEGTSGSPVSVFMPGHIAPTEERQQRKQKMKEAAGGVGHWAEVKEVKVWALCVSQDQKQIDPTA